VRSALLKTLPILVAISIDGFAQDSKFPPKGQQIPVPECLTIKGLWEGLVAAGSMPTCAAHRNSRATSRTLCQRSAGSSRGRFAPH